MEISISKFLFKNINYKNKLEIQNILNVIHKNLKTSKAYLTKETHKLNFKSQHGGKKYEILLADNKTYEYHLSTIEPVDNNHKMMHFINLNEDFDSRKQSSHFCGQEDCLFLIYDTVESGKNTLIIQGITNRDDCIKCKDDCIKCKDESHVYKTGDILMQILFKLINKSSKFSHIKVIKLSDISKKMCYNVGIELKYLRTITHGIPYYAKYGFRPATKYDQDVFKHNRNLFDKNKFVDSSVVLKLIEDNKNKFGINIYNDVYKKYFYTYLLQHENINTVDFITNIISLTELKDITKKEKKGICKFLHSIYKDLYKIIGYREYNEDKWYLRIRE